MKIEIRNLGPVEQATIDLKPLTIFVGPSNTGKTWLAYVLSAILGPDGWQEYSKAYIDGKSSIVYPPLDSAIQEVLDEGNTKINLVQFASEYGETYINDVAKMSPHWLGQFMDTELVAFEDLEVHTSLAERKRHFLKRIKALADERYLSAGRQRNGALLNSRKEREDPTVFFYTSQGEGNVLDKLPLRTVKEFLAERIFKLLHEALYASIYTFPAERTAFLAIPSLVESNHIDTTGKISQHEQRIHIAKPVAYFLDLIKDAFWRAESERREQVQTNAKIKNYIQLAHLLEHEILGGNLNFSTPEPQTHRKLLFEFTETTKLEMPVVSSMVKELSPLVLYLRYLAKPGDLLIMDEPEMNLHPEAQVRFTEFLAMLVNEGLHVLFTTHTPYMVDHLANLMKAAEHENKEDIKDRFYLKQKEAFIPKEDVSVYLFENGTAESILDQEGIIHWKTFGDVSDRVTQIYFEL